MFSDTVKTYGAITSYAVKERATYRASTLVSVIERFLALFIQINLWSALLRGNVIVNASLLDMVVFLLLNSLISTITKADIASQIESNIVDGSVSVLMTKPISYKMHLICNNLGANLYNTLVVFLPVAVVFGIFYGFPLPSTAYHLLISILSLVLGSVIMFYLHYSAGLLAFWLQQVWYVSWYLDSAVVFFGGTVLPLWFYPDSIIQLSRFLPFRYISFEAINMYTGLLNEESFPFVLLIQAAWILILHFASGIIWRAASKKMMINGG